MLVQAAVVLTPGPGVSIQGGEGVGRVTRPGLDQPVGAAAINRVPRQMIARAVAQELETAAWPGGAGVTISIPGGAGKRPAAPSTLCWEWKGAFRCWALRASWNP